MAIGTVVVGVSAVRFALIFGVDRAVGVDGLNGAVVLKMGAAVRAALLQAAPCLRANTYSVAVLHVLYVGADSYGLSNDLVADDTGWFESAC